MLAYDLGEMRSVNGSVLHFETKARASKLAVQISYMIKSTPLYKKLIEKLPSKLVLLYLQFIIKREIRPYVRQACVIQWYRRNGKQLSVRESFVKIPRYGISVLLANCWDFKDVPIKLVRMISLDPVCVNLIRKLIRSYIKKVFIKITKIFSSSKSNYSFLAQFKTQGNIACHYAEGLDPSRRNDLNWYPGSKIKPEKVIIYFDSLNNKTGKLIRKKTIQQIEERGFKWIALKRGIIEGQISYYRYVPKSCKFTPLKKNVVRDVTEDWILKAGNNLLERVEFWYFFHRELNVRVHYIPEEESTENIAQAIAYDIEKEKPGILVGKQRSEIFIPLLSDLGLHPKHIFFNWNNRIRNYLGPNYDQIKALITTGYPNKIVKRDKAISDSVPSKILRAKGINFIVALFDNAYGPEVYFSTKGMSEFYLTFLQWILDDSSVGLIVKSKKPYVIDGLFSIQPMLEKAIKTGRCIRIKDEWGRFPSDASIGVDMAVGAGISSALMESVIARCRGIHWDMTHLRNHEFYKWGYESIIFDDLEKMIAALKRYKENPESEPKLGDWSDHLDQLDPFRDGKGGQRMGTYMRWLLEGFDNGKNQDESIQYANEKYAKQWGEDKIHDLRDKDETT